MMLKVKRCAVSSKWYMRQQVINQRYWLTYWWPFSMNCSNWKTWIALTHKHCWWSKPNQTVNHIKPKTVQFDTNTRFSSNVEKKKICNDQRQCNIYWYEGSSRKMINKLGTVRWTVTGGRQQTRTIRSQNQVLLSIFKGFTLIPQN